MTKFVNNVFLVSIFDATFADQNVKKVINVYYQPFSEKWRYEPSKKQKIMQIWKDMAFP